MSEKYCWSVGGFVKFEGECPHCGSDHEKEPWGEVIEYAKARPGIDIHELSHKLCSRFGVPDGEERGRFFRGLLTLREHGWI